MDNISQISLGFVEETALHSTPAPARDDQPVNIGVRIKKLKKTDDAAVQEKGLNQNLHERPNEESLSVTGKETTSPEQQVQNNFAEPASVSPLIAADLPVEKEVFSFSPDADVSLVEEPETGSIQPRIKSGRGRKSIRQISEEADLIRIPEDEVLFLKQYYTMGEVAEMFRVNQSLLRFWEAEFDILQPKKNKKGDRYFRPADIKNLHLIYHLLRQRKYTIEGAKDFLRKGKKAEEKFEAIRKLEQIRDFLLEMKASIR